MKRSFRLTKSGDFERVRRFGKSYAHPLLILISLPNESERTRFGIAAGRSIGVAIRRNRAKRLIRAAIYSLEPEIRAGWDVVLLARRPLADASLDETRGALHRLLGRAGLLVETRSYHV